MSTTVVNLRKEAYDVYIGRPGSGQPWRWGNPFSHIPSGTRAEFVVGSRDESIAAFRQWLLESNDERAVWMRAHVGELKGKRLGCFCKPLSCHGDVLAELAEQ